MNASSRDGWQQQQQQQQQQPTNSNAVPPGQQPHTTPQTAQPLQQPQQSQQSPASSVTPGMSQPTSTDFNAPPVASANFFSHLPSFAHNLPDPTGLAQSNQATPAQDTQHQAHPSIESVHQAPPPPPQQQQQQQQQSYSLPGISQHQLQAHPSIETERERERESREMEDLSRRNAELRERDMRERQLHEQQQQQLRENHAAPIQIHQPTAIPPSVRSIHGPSGLLGNPAAQSNPAPATMSAAQALFGAPPLQMSDETAATVQAHRNVSDQFRQVLNGTMQTASSAQGSATVGGIPPSQQQPILNDALSYLDQVKVQFAEHPDVYNKFLDIMKDFKSGAIDTPGVIERVSHLFAGNPGLIQGFNTFLPPGYKIECGTGDDPNAIRVTTPMGTTISRMPDARPLSPPRGAVMNGGHGIDSAFFDATNRMTWQHQPPVSNRDVAFSPEARGNIYSAQGGPTSHPPLSPEAHREQQAAAAIHQQEQRGVSQLQNAAAAASAGALSTRNGLLSSPAASVNPLQGGLINGMSPAAMQQAMENGGLEKRGPVEFNHAISYVNKIKNRFATQPDIYKQFLEILQTYQRESKPIQDVYAQVTRLFETAPDLLEDFKQFLPESAAQSKAAARASGEEAFPLSSMRSDPSYSAAVHAHNHIHQTPRPEQPRLPPMGNFAPTPSANRDNKRKRGDRQGAVASVAPSVGPEASAGPRPGATQAANGNKRLKGTHGTKQIVGAAPEISTVTPSLVPPMPTPLPPTTSLVAEADELAFFDRVRKHIGNKGQYSEFLKLINLYTQDLAASPYLVWRAQSFIGNNAELMTFFKNFLRVDPFDEIIENQPKNVNGKIQLSNCRSLGPSYRLLPKQERLKKCSGRDQLCNDVLNDEWVSHPTWASEDSGFVAHRKNTHEEGLHRIEEERHDYDFYIESCERTVQLLEPIAQNLASANAETRRAFRLDPKLGGQSESVYRRVIYKIYGRESGFQVLTNLFLRPYDVIPILLTRFRVKLSEWKAAQAQWNQVWRTQTNLLFWRSLDHQGVATRVSDKRQFWPKQLINECTVKKFEQQKQRDLRLPAATYQYSYEFKDTDVLADAGQLVLAYIEQNMSTEYPKITSFTKEFLSLFFNDEATFEQELRTSNGSLDDGEDSSPGPDDGSSPRHKTNSKQNNLLRGVLDRPRGRASKRDNEGSAASDSRGTSPDNVSIADEDIADGVASPPHQDTSKASSSKWFTHPMDNNVINGEPVNPNENYQRHMYNLYANGNIYCFIRVFSMLYERLLKLKDNEEDVHKTVKRAKSNKAAMDVGWIEKPVTVFFGETDSNTNFYQKMLKMFDELIQGTQDMNHVEDTLRRFYLQDGYHLYSLDKLLAALARFAVLMMTNDIREKSYDIFTLFRKDRQRKDVTTAHYELQYRKQAEKLIKEDVFRITYDEHSKEVQIQMFKPEDPTFESSALTEAERWKVYVSSYESVEPTETIRYDRQLHETYSRRGLRQQQGEDAPTLDSDSDHIVSEENLQFRIQHKGEQKYMLRFEPGTFGFFTVRDAKVSLKDVALEAERRGDAAEEKIRINNRTMEGVPKDVVDERSAEYERRYTAEKVIELAPDRKRKWSPQ
ncbi:hypothetical protein EJ08DRAFT_645479 [Tothia fuscella]|uniref:Histone deacetylase interacting domain-containing protein n=1 Tax=Tothia fuscella TaxID=1048955 RepID=A0A9P4P1Z5_9PEZI|nr:hypothetical protein EJ08DRAFT_645479 [Tothia fuscella]